MSAHGTGTISFPTASCSSVSQRLTFKCTSIGEAVKIDIQSMGIFLLLILNSGFMHPRQALCH